MSDIELDLAAAHRWALSARALLDEARGRINELNVFPVPDADTGTNLFLTFDGALRYVRNTDSLAPEALTLAQGLELLARGMLLSARGNSGVILSQLAAGLSEEVAHSQRDSGQVVSAVDPRMLASAFERAADVAWAGVARPVEGTILTVARAAASGAQEAVASPRSQSGLLHAVANGALRAGSQALSETPQQLSNLARAGVVDAGGAGLLLVIEALEGVLAGRSAQGGPRVPDWWTQGVAQRIPQAEQAVTADSEADCDHGDGAFEVMYLVEDSEPESAHRLRRHLMRIGASVAVVGGPQQWRVHVHLDEPQLALEAGALAGRVTDITTSALPTGAAASVADISDANVAAGGGAKQSAQPTMAIVACASGEGIAATFARAGAETVRSYVGARVSTGALLSALRAVRADHVLVLPNDPDTILVAQAAARVARQEGLSVYVLPTRAAVQGLAALAVWDEGGSIDDSLSRMAQAAGDVTTGAVVQAGEGGDTPVGQVLRGQWLGLVSGEVISISKDQGHALKKVLQVAEQEHAGPIEIATLIQGQPGDLIAAEAAVQRWAKSHQEVSLEWMDGGQPTYAWFLGME